MQATWSAAEVLARARRLAARFGAERAVREDVAQLLATRMLELLQDASKGPSDPARRLAWAAVSAYRELPRAVRSLRRASGTRSLDGLDDEDGLPLEARLAGDEAAPEEHVVGAEVASVKRTLLRQVAEELDEGAPRAGGERRRAVERGLVAALLDRLDPLEERVVQLRFALPFDVEQGDASRVCAHWGCGQTGAHEHPVETVATWLGVSPAVVREVERRVLDRSRDDLESVLPGMDPVALLRRASGWPAEEAGRPAPGR